MKNSTAVLKAHKYRQNMRGVVETRTQLLYIRHEIWLNMYVFQTDIILQY